jgi:hypothetical protein
MSNTAVAALNTARAIPVIEHGTVEVPEEFVEIGSDVVVGDEVDEEVVTLP